MTPVQITEQLKDRQDYRNTLIERRNGIDVKIAQTEEQIRKLRENQ
jgi:hypothetical protein